MMTGGEEQREEIRSGNRYQGKKGKLREKKTTPRPIHVSG